MTLSIVILTFNQQSTTMRLLESLIPYLQAHQDTEVIIVDNGSIDGTEETIRNYLSTFKDVKDRVRIKRLDHNSGVAAGRNKGLEECHSDLLLILDNDTIINPEALDGLRQHLADNPLCGICAPALYSPEGELQSSAKPYPGIRLKFSHILHPGDELPVEKEEMKKSHPWYVIGACQMMRRSTYERVGKLDEKIFYGPEDADYCARVRYEGLTIDYLPQFSIIHDWRRATRRSPFSPLARKHIKGLIRFWIRHPYSGK